MQNRSIRAVTAALSLVVAIAAISCGQPPAAPAHDEISGRWDAELEIPAGPVPFGLDIARDGQKVTGAILNGDERQDLSGGSYDGGTLTLALDYYDGKITARFADPDKKTLVGEYARQTRSGVGTYKFRATRHAPVAGATTQPVAEGGAASGLAGDWIMTIKGEGGAADEVDEATFRAGAARGDRVAVSGTVIPVSGDYGLLGGEAWVDPADERAKFRLSRFDGIHVTLLTGAVQPDGSLAGEIASGLTYRAPFTAVRKSTAEASGEQPADPNALTRVKDPSQPFAFSIPDLSGQTVTLADERFKDKVVLVDIFGTWCPNCHDEAPLLVELDRKYRDKGLAVVGLAYEYTDDIERNRKQIEIYKKKYGIDFPVLMAGTTNEGEIARTLPQLEGFGAYPTTIFIGRDGRVRKIHAGFSGPATGERHGEVKREFDETIASLLAE
jgi:thiol-disulfide isomerase/thioredoxin